MRISVVKGDDGYLAGWLGSRVDVTLDGKQVTHVLMADEERGELVRFVTPFRIVGGSPLKERLCGAVRIHFVDREGALAVMGKQLDS